MGVYGKLFPSEVCFQGTFKEVLHLVKFGTKRCGCISAFNLVAVCCIPQEEMIKNNMKKHIFG